MDNTNNIDLAALFAAADAGTLPEVDSDAIDAQLDALACPAPITEAESDALDAEVDTIVEDWIAKGLV